MPGERILSAAEAIREALDLALASDPAVYLIGEGVADPKGIYGTTLGLVEKYGQDRVIETPVSENGFTGIAIGSALRGQRPVIVHQRVEFCLLAMEQVINNAAKLHYVTGGKHSVPIKDLWVFPLNTVFRAQLNPSSEYRQTGKSPPHAPRTL